MAENFPTPGFAQLLSQYHDLMKSTAVAADSYMPYEAPRDRPRSMAPLPTDIVGGVGDGAKFMWDVLGVPRATQQTLTNNYPMLQTGPQIRAQTNPVIGPAFWRQLVQFLPSILNGAQTQDPNRLRAEVARNMESWNR
jgi:hypothetical protein